MQLKLDGGYISKEHPPVFYRVEDYRSGAFKADFTTLAEATSFAIKDAEASGCRFDHRVRTMRLSRA